MSGVRARSVLACLGVLVVMVGVSCAMPVRIYLPFQLRYNMEPTVGVSAAAGDGEDRAAETQGRKEVLAAYLPQRHHRPLPEKRYLGIELPDFIAASKNLGKLKEKMMSSGK